MAFPSGPAFFVRRPGETIYDLMAASADPGDGLTADILKAALKDADPLEVAEIFAELEDALRRTGK